MPLGRQLPILRNNAGALMGLLSAGRRVRLAAVLPQTDQWAGSDGKQNDSFEPRRGGKPWNQRQKTADGPEDEGEAGQADQSSGREGFPHLFHCSGPRPLGRHASWGRQPMGKKRHRRTDPRRDGTLPMVHNVPHQAVQDSSLRDLVPAAKSRSTRRAVDLLYSPRWLFES